MTDLIHQLQFETERRGIQLASTTTMPDLSSLGYNADPNLAVNGNTAGETLLYYAPLSVMYIQDNGVLWVKNAGGPAGTWVVIGAGSGLGLTEIEQLTLDNFHYDPVGPKLVADISIQSPLESILLGGMHKMSSAGYGVVQQNMSTGTAWLPATVGIKDHSDAANRLPGAGIILQKGRVYSDYFDSEANGLPASNYLPFAEGFPIAVNFAVFGLEVIVEEAIVPSDVIHYHLYIGTDDTGIEMYRQTITDMTVAAGGIFSFWFRHPVDIKSVAGNVYAILNKHNNGTTSTVSVLAGLTDTNKIYAKSRLRTFEDKPIAYTEDLTLVQTNVDIVDAHRDYDTAIGEHHLNTVYDSAGELILWSDGDLLEWGDEKYDLHHEHDSIESPNGLNRVTSTDVDTRINQGTGWTAIRVNAEGTVILSPDVTHTWEVTNAGFTMDAIVLSPLASHQRFYATAAGTHLGSEGSLWTADLTDTGFIVADATRSRLELTATTGRMYAPSSSNDYLKMNDTNMGFIMDGSNRLHITGSTTQLKADGSNYIQIKSASVKINQGGKKRLWMDNGETEVYSPNSLNWLYVADNKVAITYASLDRISATATTTKLESPDGLQDITVTDLGSFYNGSEILTVSDKAANNGVAPLDAFGLVPTIHLPSYVDDIEEHATLAALILADPQATDKIYITLDDNLTYRYSGTPGNYVVVSQSLAIGETDSTAYRGDRGKIAYDHSQSAHDYAATAHNHSTVISPNSLNFITVSDLTMAYYDGTETRISSDATVTALFSPDGLKNLYVNNTGAFSGAYYLVTSETGVIHGSASVDNAIATFDGTSGKQVQNSAVTIDDSGVMLGISGMTINDGGGDRLIVSNSVSMLISPDGLQSLYVNDTGAFAGGGEILTSLTGVKKPVSATANAVARYNGTTGGIIKDSSVVITDLGVLSFDNYKAVSVNFIVVQSEDVVVDVLTETIFVIVDPGAGITNFTVRDLNGNIGTYNVRIIFFDGTDELFLTQPHDFVQMSYHNGIWYYYNIRTGLGAKVST